jgi:hypothetical protein
MSSGGGVRIGHGMLRSYLEPAKMYQHPPRSSTDQAKQGAPTSRSGWGNVGVGVLPLLERLLGLLEEFLKGSVGTGVTEGTRMRAGRQAYAELAGIRDVLVGLKQVADVQCLHPPEIATDTPTERGLEGSSVERAVVDDGIGSSESLRREGGGYGMVECTHRTADLVAMFGGLFLAGGDDGTLTGA